MDIRSPFALVDRVTAGSGRPVFVFNIAGKRFCSIAAIHFNQQHIFTLRFLTHAEYDNENKLEVCGVSEGLRWALPSAFASPIRSVAESDEAYELASVMAGHQLTKDQDDYLEALTSFIEQYENKAHPMPRKKTHPRDSPVSLLGERNERRRLEAIA